ncbi:lachesin, partial [Caerostris extrusa]
AAWIKVETKAILTIYHHIITRNYRISLSHSDNRNFILQIRNVQESDKGGYMCQVNTVPMKSQVGYLDVLVFGCIFTGGYIVKFRKWDISSSGNENSLFYDGKRDDKPLGWRKKGEMPPPLPKGDI